MIPSRAEGEMGAGDQGEAHGGTTSHVSLPDLGGSVVGFPCETNLNLCASILYIHLYGRRYGSAIATKMPCNKPAQYSGA